MPDIAIQCCTTPATRYCGVCGRATDIPAGTSLCVADNRHPVCEECGRKYAPSLAALVHLASTAERVGRIHRHSVFPPLSALLDLASAAERYTAAAQAPARRAG